MSTIKRENIVITSDSSICDNVVNFSKLCFSFLKQVHLVFPHGDIAFNEYGTSLT